MRFVAIVGVSVVVASAASILASSAFVSWRLSAVEARLAEVEQARTTTSTEPTIKMVDVSERTRVVPESAEVLLRRQSPVYALVRNEGKGESVLLADKEIGAAVAVTADGWLVTSQSVIAGLKLADLSVVIEQRPRAVDRAVRDQATDAVFLHVAVSGLSPAAFVRAENVLSGQSAWLEPRPRRIYADRLADVRLSRMTEAVSSERAARRFLVSRGEAGDWAGGAVWDADGRLLGLLEKQTPEGWTVLPAESFGQAFVSLVGTGEIRHPVLGVRAVELGTAIVGKQGSTLPVQGAYLVSQKGLLAVKEGGPAAGKLVEGDVITRLDRDLLDGTVDLGERLLAYRPGATVLVGGVRNGKPFEVTVTLGSATTSEAMR